MADEQRTLTANFTADSSGFAHGADEVVQKLKELNQDLEQNKAKVKELNATMREYQKELDRLNRETNNGENATEEQTARMQELRDSITQCAVEIGTYQAAQGQLRSQISSANRELTEQREALDDTSEGFSAFADAASGAVGIVKDGIALALEKAQELDSAVGKLSASIGASAEETEKYKNVITEVYRDNFGEDFYDVADSVAAVTRNLKELDDTELKKITEGALTLRDVFEYDVDETTRAAKALVTNFDISASEAMDYIASGARGGLDFSGELLDSISEYSVQFAKMGLGVSDMFAIMQAGADEGAWNLDKVGDAIKELAITAIDGSKSTKEAFEIIGLPANEIAAQLAEGGDVAYEAFVKVIDALEAVEDPLKQDAAGVALMKSMWEDLGADVVLSFNGIKDASYDATGAMEEMMGVAYDDTAASLEQLRRELELAVVPIGEKLLPMAQEFVNDIKPEIPAISDAIKGVLGTVANLIKILWESRDAVIAGVAAFGTFKTVISIGNIISGTVTAIKALKGATDAATVSQKLFNATAAANPYVLLASAIAAVTAAVGAYAIASRDAAGEIEQINNVQSDLHESMQQSAEKAKEYIEACEDIKNVILEYQKLTTAVDDTEQANEALYALQQDIIDQYGMQAEGIDLVNGKYSEQVTILNDLYDKHKEMAVASAKAALMTAEQTMYGEYTIDNDVWGAINGENGYLNSMLYEMNISKHGIQGHSTSKMEGTSRSRYEFFLAAAEDFAANKIDNFGYKGTEYYNWLVEMAQVNYDAWQEYEDAKKRYEELTAYHNPSTTHSSNEYYEELGKAKLAESEKIAAAAAKAAELSNEESKKQYDTEKQLADDRYSVG